MADTIKTAKVLGVIIEGRQNQSSGGLRIATKTYELPNPKDDLTEQDIRTYADWLRTVALHDPKFNILQIQGATINGAYTEIKTTTELDLTGV